MSFIKLIKQRLVNFEIVGIFLMKNNTDFGRVALKIKSRSARITILVLFAISLQLSFYHAIVSRNIFSQLYLFKTQ
jgi:hypothetical protein